MGIKSGVAGVQPTYQGVTKMRITIILNDQLVAGLEDNAKKQKLSVEQFAINHLTKALAEKVAQNDTLAGLTPSNAKLRELAAKYPPPLEYFDGDEEVPFEPITE
jgi:hypothetical protein